MLRFNAVFVILSCGMLLGMQEQGQTGLQTERHSNNDLEIRGVVEGAPENQSRFASKQFLASMPSVQTKVKPDEDFTGIPETGVQVTGVDLDVLSQKLGAASDTTIVAICEDGYASPLPSEYRRAHHPILVTAIDGFSPEDWAKKNHRSSPGPYFVAYRDFVPSFKVLAHDDRRQVPTQVIRLEYTTAEKFFEPIKPQGTYTSDSPVMQGYRIAQQNCLRCHASGESGGRKSQKSWQSIGYMAKTEPDAFAAWVHNPQAVVPQAEMPANLEYDRATLTALTKYFATFAVD